MNQKIIAGSKSSTAPPTFTIHPGDLAPYSWSSHLVHSVNPVKDTRKRRRKKKTKKEVDFL